MLNLDPRHRGAFNNLGVIALDQEHYPEAENWFRRAEDIDPSNAKAHFLLAKALLGKKDRQAAERELDAAIQLKPDQVEFRQLREELRSGENRQ